jgi:hypothetical protein
MNEPDDARLLRAHCACGWETVGEVETAVDATIDHGQRVHNMTATRDDVLASAEWLEAVEKGGPA